MIQNDYINVNNYIKTSPKICDKDFGRYKSLARLAKEISDDRDFDLKCKKASENRKTKENS